MTSPFRYERARLAEREWYKIVVHSLPSKFWHLRRHKVYDPDSIMLKHRIGSALKHCQGAVMHRDGGTWHVIMVSEQDDVIWLMMKLGLTSKDLRGKKDWSKVPRYRDTIA